MSDETATEILRQGQFPPEAGPALVDNALAVAEDDGWAVDPADIAYAEKTAIPAATFKEPETVPETGWGDDADLLPDGAGGPGNDEWDDEAQIDLSDLRINLSAQEAQAESFDDMPAGKYVVAITDGKVERSKSKKNPGKPMYNLTYTVQDGKFTRAKVFDRLCLWEGAAYSYSMLVKALGFNVNTGSNRVIPLTELIGKTMTIRWGKGKANTVQNDDGTTTTYEARMQVKGYFPAPSGTDRQNAAQAADPLAP
jgi:hypothetical protein